MDSNRSWGGTELKIASFSVVYAINRKKFCVIICHAMSLLFWGLENSFWQGKQWYCVRWQYYCWRLICSYITKPDQKIYDLMHLWGKYEYLTHTYVCVCVSTRLGFWNYNWIYWTFKLTKLNSVAWDLEKIIPAQRPSIVGEVSAIFYG
jgi:hypothetical protein